TAELQRFTDPMNARDTLIVCPTFQPSPALRQRCAARGIHFQQMAAANPLHLNLTMNQARTTSSDSAVLTPDEQAEFQPRAAIERANDRGPEWSMHLPGTREKRRNHVVLNGREATIADAEFVYLVRLVVARLESADGFTDLGQTMHGGGIAAE